MEDMIVPLIFAVFAVFFTLIASLTYRKSWKLKDFRTLKLGRLVLRSLFWSFIAINFAIVTIALFFPHNGDNLILALAIEFLLLFVLGPVLMSIFIVASIIILTIKMWRRESKSVANLLLPLIMLVFFALSTVYSFVNGLPRMEWDWLRTLATIYPVMAIYLTWQFMVFYVSSRAYGHREKKLAKTANYKYYVVHGAGLVGGQKVGTLLANRIKAAVDAAGDDTILVLSGGKGDDEHLSEAQAMQNYAVNELKFPIARTMLEDQSRTTYENLVNSAKIINDKFLIFTSDYHVFRTVLFAAQLNLDAQGGPGGKTAFYYRVPAFLREFIAVLNSHRKKHIIIVACIVAFFGFLAVLSLWFASRSS